MSKSSMKATSVRSLLIVCVLLAVGAVAGGFYYGLERVKEYAIEVSHTYADANAAERQISELQKLKTTLASSQTLVKKADQLFATESNYQSRAVQDVQRYARQTGVTVTNTDFPESQQAAGSHTLTIGIKSPVSYERLIRFLEAIEGNLPKMQLSGIKISRASGSGVTVENISIEVATR
jgi:hypothetical protein